jgi:hypothetical protein
MCLYKDLTQKVEGNKQQILAKPKMLPWKLWLNLVQIIKTKYCCNCFWIKVLKEKKVIIIIIKEWGNENKNQKDDIKLWNSDYNWKLLSIKINTKRLLICFHSPITK